MRTSVLMLLLLAACSTPVPVRFGAHAATAPIVAVSHPGFADGDPVAGRRAFIALQCIDCHRVAGDRKLPLGRRAVAGPLLSGLDSRAPNEVADRITSRSTGAGEELFDRTMKDYTEPITARTLADVVAYLRQFRVERG